MKYPEVIQNLIDNFASLPGIGQKTAERLVFYLLKSRDEKSLQEFGQNLSQIKAIIKVCPQCGDYKENDHCQICDDVKREKNKICVVAEAQDILYLDKTGSYKGLYHILGGLLSPALGVTIDKLKVNELLKRMDGVEEIIFGFNPTVEGETTIIYLKKIIKEKYPKIKTTRLSRGLPMGGDLEYADEITLANAIDNRSEV